MPMCENCVKPLKNDTQHFCHNCGKTVGNYTRYLPYEGIWFNYDIFGTLWRKINSQETPVSLKILYLFLTAVIAPAVLIVGLPIKLHQLGKIKKTHAEAPSDDLKNGENAND